MFAVVMTGGSGTRFWPLSRAQKPKQFLNITGKGPMVLETCDRLSPLVRDDEVILVLGQEHLEDAKEIFKGRGVHMIAEPVGRNTAPCIGLGAIYSQHLGYEGAVAFLPADHYIGDRAAFLKALGQAGELAGSGGIVTLGIVPSRPETGYGYIRRDKGHIDYCGFDAYKVLEFVEKPDFEKARCYLASGDYFWNGGIFVAKPETVLEEIREHLPDLHNGLMRLKRSVGTRAFEAELREVYAGLVGISFDYGIMEKTDGTVYVIPCDCGWSDVGSWASLYELRTSEQDDHQNVIDSEALLIDCERSFVTGRGGRLVACLGLKNCLVVDTPEAVLVADLDRSQDIRKLVAQLKRSGKGNLL